MANQVEIKSINHHHQAIMDLMIARPDITQGEIARTLKKTPAWICTVINSTVFQATYAEVRSEYFHTAVVPLAQKMLALTNLAVDRTTENLHNGLLTARETKDLTIDALKLAGFGGKVEEPATTVNLVINSTLIDQAHARLNSPKETIIDVPHGE